MTNPNDPISPSVIPVMDTSQGSVAFKVGEQFFTGLTKREYFAAMAMQFLAIRDQKMTSHWKQDIAENACLIADALIAELNK